MSLQFSIVQVIPNKAVIGAISNTWTLIPGWGWLLTPAKVKIQGKIDEHFFGDPKRRKKKKKKIKMDFEEDMW